MKDETLLRVEHVSKRFCRDLKKSLWYGVKDIAGEMFGRSKAKLDLRPHEFWALKDISFELKQGQTLGLIGQNGAGKTTLLRIINGLIKTDRGKITLKGRLGALIQLGAGFHPLLTGRENIYINGAVLGMGKREINRKLDKIIDFSGVEDFIDAPVQSYSSGMRVRLGFSVAVHLDPDILLIDEVLAVGDIHFQRNCLRRIKKFVDRGGRVILVSHSMDKIRAVCTHGIYLNQGKMKLHGEIQSVIKSYLDDMNLQAAGDNDDNRGQNELASVPRGTPIMLSSVEFSSPSAAIPNTVQFGETVTVRFRYQAVTDVDNVTFGISLWTNNNNIRLTDINSRLIGKSFNLRKGIGEVKCQIPRFPIAGGKYFVKGGVYDGNTMWPYHRLGYDDENPFLIKVLVNTVDEGHLFLPRHGLVYVKATWDIHDGINL